MIAFFISKRRKPTRCGITSVTFPAASDTSICRSYKVGTSALHSAGAYGRPSLLQAPVQAFEAPHHPLRSPSSSVNFRSFLDFLTASHARILTARKSDFANVSKSTISLKIGSIFTLEKSTFSTGFASSADASAPSAFAYAFFAATAPTDFIVGNNEPMSHAIAFL